MAFTDEQGHFAATGKSRLPGPGAGLTIDQPYCSTRPGGEAFERLQDLCPRVFPKVVNRFEIVQQG
jgi:hypothetical protein